jgi:hypothetical protein
MSADDVPAYAIALRRDIYNSREVQLALAVARARSSNNWARFFHLVKEADFLLACIIHRHFNSIRLKALKVLNKTFYPKEVYPLEEFILLLGFEDSNHAINFCKYYRLPADMRGVTLKDKIIVEQKVPPPIRRSMRLVGSRPIANDISAIVRAEGKTPSFPFLPSPSLPSPLRSSQISRTSPQLQPSLPKGLVRPSPTKAGLTRSPLLLFEQPGQLRREPTQILSPVPTPQTTSDDGFVRAPSYLPGNAFVNVLTSSSPPKPSAAELLEIERAQEAERERVRDMERRQQEDRERAREIERRLQLERERVHEERSRLQMEREAAILAAQQKAQRKAEKEAARLAAIPKISFRDVMYATLRHIKLSTYLLAWHKYVMEKRAVERLALEKKQEAQRRARRNIERAKQVVSSPEASYRFMMGRKISLSNKPVEVDIEGTVDLPKLVYSNLLQKNQSETSSFSSLSFLL